MTIFHIIKYPISSPPTMEELESLPKEIITKWQDHSRLVKNADGRIRGIHFLHSGLFIAQNRRKRAGYFSIHDALESIASLRRIIQDLE